MGKKIAGTPGSRAEPCLAQKPGQPFGGVKTEVRGIPAKPALFFKDEPLYGPLQEIIERPCILCCHDQSPPGGEEARCLRKKQGIIIYMLNHIPKQNDIEEMPV